MDATSHVKKFVGIGVVWILVFMLALAWGAVADADWNLISQVRLPRVILAAAVGSGLAVAGACLQALFANALCEPYTLGISSGAALGAVLGMSLGLNWTYAGLVIPSFFGAFIFAGVLFLISLRKESTQASLLLSGVMLGFLGNSCVALWISLADENGLQGTLSWMFGDLSRAQLAGAVFTAIGVFSLTGCLYLFSSSFDLLLMGEQDAVALGLDVKVVRRRLILIISILIGFCVGASGMIGFIGLVVAHFGRRCVGSLHQYLLPFCAVAGGVLLMVADLISRIAIRPYELPVGVITSFIGAPLFIFLLFKRGRSFGHSC